MKRKGRNQGSSRGSRRADRARVCTSRKTTPPGGQKGRGLGRAAIFTSDFRQLFTKASCNKPPHPTSPGSFSAPPAPPRCYELKDFQGLELLLAQQERMFYFLHTEEKRYLLFLFLKLSNAFHLVYFVFCVCGIGVAF